MPGPVFGRSPSIILNSLCGPGLRDLDKFDSSEEIKRFAEDEGCSQAADLACVLWEMGFRSCAALDRVTQHDPSAFERLLDPHTTSGDIAYLRKFAREHNSKLSFSF